MVQMVQFVNKVTDFPKPYRSM